MRENVNRRLQSCLSPSRSFPLLESLFTDWPMKSQMRLANYTKVSFVKTGLLIIFLSAATFIWGIPENKCELWGYIRSNINVRKTPASRTMNLQWRKFLRVHLTRFRLVQRQSAADTAHTSALSWHSPFKDSLSRIKAGERFI